jgi:Tfp pilus assembly protein PilE
MRVSSSRPSLGFALMELVLVVAAVILLAAMTWPLLSSARKAGRVTSCTANLRQIGHAFELYHDEYDRYPSTTAIVKAPYITDQRVLLCPEDTLAATTGAASSYAFIGQAPPDWRLISEVADVDPDLVLVAGDQHLKRRTYFAGDDDARQTAPEYPYEMVLRASGAVERIDESRIRRLSIPARRPTFRKSYPGEPGYEKAEKP